MKAVAYSGAEMLPAPMRRFPPQGRAIEHKSCFTPGLQIKVLLETGGEEGALLRWSA